MRIEIGQCPYSMHLIVLRDMINYSRGRGKARNGFQRLKDTHGHPGTQQSVIRQQKSYRQREGTIRHETIRAARAIAERRCD